MSKLDKVLALYSIISGAAMFVMWGVFYAVGVVTDELASSPVWFLSLACAECLTAIGLLSGGIALFRSRRWARDLTLVSTGMLLYAVLIGCGQFAQRGNVLLTAMFAVLSVATAVILIVNLFRRGDLGSVQS
jgi:hypothetical protein